MAISKSPDARIRVQAYLDPSVMEVIRQMSRNLDMPESRVVSHLVKVGLGIQSTQAVALAQTFAQAPQ